MEASASLHINHSALIDSSSILVYQNNCVERTKRAAKTVLILAACAATSALVTTILGAGMFSIFAGSVFLVGGHSHLLTLLKDGNAASIQKKWMEKALIIGVIALGCGIAMAPTGIALLSAGIETGSLLTSYTGVSALAFTLFMAKESKDLIFSPENFLKQKYQQMTSLSNSFVPGNAAPQEPVVPGMAEALNRIAQTTAVQAQKCLQFSMMLSIPKMSNGDLNQFLNENYNAEAWGDAIKYATPEQKNQVIVPFLKAFMNQASEAAIEKPYKMVAYECEYGMDDDKELTFDDYLAYLKKCWTQTDSPDGKNTLSEKIQGVIWERKKDLYLARDPAVQSVMDLLSMLQAQEVSFSFPSDSQSKTEELNQLAQKSLEFCGVASENKYTTDAITALGEMGFNIGDLQDVSKSLGISYGPALAGKLKSAELATKADLQFAGILPKPYSGENLSKNDMKQRLTDYLLMKPKALNLSPETHTIERVVKAAKQYFFNAFQVSQIAISFIRSPVATTIGTVIGYGTMSLLPPPIKVLFYQLAGRMMGPGLSQFMREASAQDYVAQLCSMLFVTRIVSSFSLLNFSLGIGVGMMSNLTISHYRQRMAPVPSAVEISLV